MEEGHFMKKVFGALAFLSFFYLLGVVGSIEKEMMTLGVGTIHMAVSLVCFGLFGKLYGLLESKQRKSR
jgi:hypothetical protein